MNHRRMKGKHGGKVTLEGLDRRLDGFEGALDGFKSTLGEFGGTLDEFKGTLHEIGEMLGFVVERMVTKDDARGFANKEDLKIFATKDDLNQGLFGLQTQMNGIESGIRDMEHARLEVRVAELEEKVFGKAR